VWKAFAVMYTSPKAEKKGKENGKTRSVLSVFGGESTICSLRSKSRKKNPALPVSERGGD